MPSAKCQPRPRCSGRTEQASGRTMQRALDFDQPAKICLLHIDCRDEIDQARLAKWLRAKGYEVREVTI